MRYISTFFLLGFALTLNLSAQNTFAPSLFVGYSLERVNAGPGQCGCFTLNGGETELALPTKHSLQAVVDVSGETTSSVSGGVNGLSLLTFVAGPRLQPILWIHGRRSRFEPFIETLAGVSHGFNSFFPENKSSSSATAFAFLAGGGLNLYLSPHFEIRPAQIDYVFTEFPNGTNNRQNDLRVSTGIILTLR